MQTFLETFEVQVDEKPNGAVIRINDVRGCRIRICGVPKELVFDEQGEVRSSIDITYPKELTSIQRATKAVELMEDSATQKKPKNLTLSKLGEKFKREKKVVKFKAVPNLTKR
jgi:hypothetical protein